jgi:hypothetical protein
MNLSGEGGPDLGELQLGESPGTESGIAEVFELLRRSGKTDQEIILEIFKRDITADVQEIGQTGLRDGERVDPSAGLGKRRSRRIGRAPGAEKGGPLRPSTTVCRTLTARFEAF